MRVIVLCLSVLVFLAGDLAAQQRGFIRATLDERMTRADDFPRVSLDQRRPGVEISACAPGTPCEPDPGDGSGGSGSGTCLQNFKCTGGAICATGLCVAEEGKGCSWCAAGEKCNSCR